MISIVIPVYNNPQKLKRALKSIVKQNYTDYEVIVVDDESAVALDNTINSFKKSISRLRSFRVKHGGANKARQYGAGVATGEYIIFWDDDVIAKPHMLETMLSTLRDHPEASYVYSSHIFGWKKFKLWPFDENRLKKMPYIHTTSLIRTKHFVGFDPEIKRMQDWDLWLSMLEKGYKGVFIPEYLFKVISGGTMSLWLPKCFYSKPVRYLLPKFILKKTQKYDEAVEVIKRKHNL